MLRSVLVASAVIVAAIPQTPSPPTDQQLPTFRTGVDIVELDVTVLDKDRRPVKGLTADDFTILDRGKPQPIVAFSAVDVPAPPSYSATWMRDAPLDVVSNLQNGRLVTIVMDDAYTGQSPTIMKRAKDIAHAAIDQLGPRDLASVVFTFTGRMQNFTADRSALIRAVDSFAPKHGPGGVAGSCDPMLRSCDIETIFNVASAFLSAPPGRKIVVLVSGGRRFAFGQVGDAGLPSSAAHRDEGAGLVEAFNALQRGNVTIYAFDVTGIPLGLMSNRGAPVAGPFSLAGSVSELSANESLRSFAESTGGRAFTNTNDPAAGVRGAFRESSTYYFLGFRPAAAAGHTEFRKVEVKLNRPGLNVRTRNGYYTPGKGSAPVDVINGLPGGDLPLRATSAVFAVPGQGVAQVVLAAGIDSVGATLANKSVDLSAIALDLDGHPQGSEHHSTTLKPDSGSDGISDFPFRLSLKPGRYLVQLSAVSERRSGRVVVDVEVPNFSREALSASGLIVSRRTDAPASDRALTSQIPFLPSTQRRFRPDDDVAVFVRLYQGGTEKISPVRVSTRVIDERNVAKIKQQTVLESTSFSAARSADYQVPLPLRQLTPGEYLLEVEAQSGNRRVQRTARFSVR